MNKFFLYGQKTVIIILCVVDFISFYGAITTGAWHLWIIIIMVSILAASLYRDLKREISKHKSI